MTPDEYSRAAMRTAEPGQFFGENVGSEALKNELYALMRASEQLDTLKKALFYNKVIRSGAMLGYNCNVFAQHTPECPPKRIAAILELHGIVGVASEVGELVSSWLTKKPKSNKLEEIGDLLWYINLILEANGFTFEQAMRANIAKLEKRYPEKFTTELATNRDLAAEEKVLTASVSEKLCKPEYWGATWQEITDAISAVNELKDEIHDSKQLDVLLVTKVFDRGRKIAIQCFAASAENEIRIEQNKLANLEVEHIGEFTQAQYQATISKIEAWQTVIATAKQMLSRIDVKP